MSKRRRLYDNIIKSYVYAFAVKHGFIEKDEPLPVDAIYGGVVFLGDLTFAIDDIMHDMDSNIPKGVILEWYDYAYDVTTNGYTHVSYRSYLRGFRHKKRTFIKEMCYRFKAKLKWVFRKRLPRKDKVMLRKRVDDIVGDYK